MSDYVAFLTRHSSYVCPYTGTTFEFTDQFASRDVAHAKQQEYTRGVIRERETLAGQRLSHRQLLDGVAHPDDRTLREQIKGAGSVRGTSDQVSLTASDKARAMHAEAAELKKRAAWIGTPAEQANYKRRAAMMENAAKAMEATGESKDAVDTIIADRDANPAYVAARTHAAGEIAMMKFDTRISQKDFADAETRLAVLTETGDTVDYWRSAFAWIEIRDEKQGVTGVPVATVGDLARKIEDAGIPKDVSEQLAVEQTKKEEVSA